MKINNKAAYPCTCFYHKRLVGRKTQERILCKIIFSKIYF
jgi:hypothetical protein